MMSWVCVTTAHSLPSARLIVVCHTMVVRPRCRAIDSPTTVLPSLAAAVAEDAVADVEPFELLDPARFIFVADIGEDDDVGVGADLGQGLGRAGHQILAVHLGIETSRTPSRPGSSGSRMAWSRARSGATSGARSGAGTVRSRQVGVPILRRARVA